MGGGVQPILNIHVQNSLGLLYDQSFLNSSVLCNIKNLRIDIHVKH